METAYRKYNHLTQLKLISQLNKDTLGVIFNAAKLGDLVTIDLPSRTNYMVFSPEAYHQILVKQADKFAKDEQYTDKVNGLAMFMGEGLLTSNGDFWRRQRKLVQPAFHTKRIEAYAETMVEETQKVMDSWEDNSDVDVAAEMMRLTLNIVAKTLFGANVESETARVAHAMHAFQELAGKPPSFAPAWLPTARRRHARRSTAVLDDIIYRIINDRRATKEDTGDLLSMLLLAQDDEGSGMTDKQVRDEAVTLFLAGHETTANALNWTWVLLSQHPDVAQKLHAELDTVLAGRAPTLADLPNLPYTEMVIKESMRLYPPVYAMSRMTVEDVDIDDENSVATIPKGRIVRMFPIVAHHDPRWWDNPEDFMPERWQDGNPARHKFAYIPFGAGPRICIGSSFAMMEAQLLLATLASHWEFSLAPNQSVTPEPLITLRPKNGLPMTLTHRQPELEPELA